MEPNLNARAGNRPSTVAAAAGPSLGEAVGPERRPSGCCQWPAQLRLPGRVAQAVSAVEARPERQSRPPHDHWHDDRRTRNPRGRAAGADSRSRTSWQRWLWPGGIQRLGAGAFPASRLTLMTELDSELGSFNFISKLPTAYGCVLMRMENGICVSCVLTFWAIAYCELCI